MKQAALSSTTLPPSSLSPSYLSPLANVITSRILITTSSSWLKFERRCRYPTERTHAAPLVHRSSIDIIDRKIRPGRQLGRPTGSGLTIHAIWSDLVPWRPSTSNFTSPSSTPISDYERHTVPTRTPSLNHKDLNHDPLHLLGQEISASSSRQIHRITIGFEGSAKKAVAEAVVLSHEPPRWGESRRPEVPNMTPPW